MVKKQALELSSVPLIRSGTKGRRWDHTKQGVDLIALTKLLKT